MLNLKISRRLLIIGVIVLMSTSPAFAQQKLIKISSIDVPYIRIMVTKWAELINRYIPEVRATVTSVNSNLAPRAVDSGDVDIAYTGAITAYEAYNGLKPLFDGVEHKNIRFLILAGPFMPAYVTLDRNPIKSISDMGTMKVHFNQGPKGYLAPTVMEKFFELCGVTYDTIKKNGGTVNFLGFDDAFQQLQDGRIDVAYTLGFGPFPPLVNVDMLKPVRFLTADPAKLEEFVKKTPGVREAKIPKGDYYKVASQMDIDTVVLDYVYIINAKLPDDLVYRITQLSVEKLDEWHLQFRNEYEKPYNGVDKSLMGAAIPVHPGAVKYYREQKIEFAPGYGESGIIQ